MKISDKVFVPVLLEEMKYPPSSKFRPFEDEFAFAEKFVLDFTGSDIDALAIIKEVKRAYTSQVTHRIMMTAGRGRNQWRGEATERVQN